MKRLFGIVLSSALLLGSLFAPLARAETSALFLHIPVAPIQEGDRITVDVLVRSPSQSVNAVSGTLVFPEALVSVIGVSKSNSVINLWTRAPSVQRGKIVFEGIILNPGFQGNSGAIFHVTFEAKRAGTVPITFSNGAVLANDGLGSNIASGLMGGSFKIQSGIAQPSHVAVAIPPEIPATPVSPEKIVALPVITDYSASVDAKGSAFIKGKGEPNALTKIEFKNTSFKSVGEQFITFLQTKKSVLDSAIVKNDAAGSFEYTTPSNIIAGAYNATPYLVDEKTDAEKPGLGVQLFVSDSPFVRVLVIVINVLALLIPVVGLGVVIYFIPWYSFRRMRLLGRRFSLEEEKFKFSTRAFEPSHAAAPPEPVPIVIPPEPTPVVPMEPVAPQVPVQEPIQPPVEPPTPHGMHESPVEPPLYPPIPPKVQPVTPAQTLPAVQPPTIGSMQ